MVKKKGRFEDKKVEIGGIQYIVKYRKPKPVSNNKDLTVRGEIMFNDRIIYLERGLSPSEEILTLIHEILHGIIDSIIPAGIALEIDDGAEELFVESLSRALSTSLRSISLLKE